MLYVLSCYLLGGLFRFQMQLVISGIHVAPILYPMRALIPGSRYVERRLPFVSGKLAPQTRKIHSMFLLVLVSWGPSAREPPRPTEVTAEGKTTNKQ